MNPTGNTAPPPAAPAEERIRSTPTKDLLEMIIDDQSRADLIKMEVEAKHFEHDQRLAQMFYRAQYFTDLKSVEQAIAKIEIGRSWKMTAADAIRYIYVVNGKPSLENEYYAAKMMDAGWSWDVQWIGPQGSQCKGVRLFVSFGGKPKLDPEGKQVVVEFTYEMAEKIIIYQNNERISILNKKGPWSDGFRSNMMYWRCIANLRRFYCPNVLTGALLRDETFDIADLDVVPSDPEMPTSRMEKALAAKKEKRGAVLVENVEEVKATPEQMKAAQAFVDEANAGMEKVMAEKAAKAEAAQKAEAETTKAAADTKEPEPETKREAAETKQADPEPEGYLNAPPTPTLLKKITQLEPVVTTAKYLEVLNRFGYMRSAQIPTEAKANDILAELRELVKKESK